MIKKIFIWFTSLVMFICAGILLAVFSREDFLFLLKEISKGNQVGVGQYFSVQLLLAVDFICTSWILVRMAFKELRRRELWICFTLEVICGGYGFFWLTMVNFIHVAIGLIYIKRCIEK